MSKSDTVVSADVRAALVRQISEAALALRSGEISDEAIHTIRKKLKAARAKLRLLRAAVGRQRYARENAALRDAARPMSAVRDSKVMLDLVNDLLKRKGTRARRVLLVALRGRLRQTHGAARARFEADKHAVDSSAALRRSSQRIARWTVSPRAHSALERSLRRLYKAASRAFTAAEAQDSSENLHELRKQVKYLREALAPLDGKPLRGAAKIVERADKLASVLGEHHDLHVLQAHVAATEASAHAHSDRFAADIERKRARLARDALKRGGRLFRKRPRAFTRRLAL